MRFLIHNYFPAPSEPFVLNLASKDRALLRQSRGLCHEAMRLCKKLGSPFYSVHAGFCFSAKPKDLGEKQSHLPLTEREQAKEIFLESVRELGAAGNELGVELLVENNVVSHENSEGGMQRYLGVRADELLEFSAEKNVALLLDTAHLKVSAQSLDFSLNEEIEALASSVHAVHLSDNDSQADTNQPLTEDTPEIEYLVENGLQKIPWILEAYGLSEELLVSQGRLLSKVLEGAE